MLPELKVPIRRVVEAKKLANKSGWELELTCGHVVVRPYRDRQPLQARCTACLEVQRKQATCDHPLVFRTGVWCSRCGANVDI